MPATGTSRPNETTGIYQPQRSRPWAAPAQLQRSGANAAAGSDDQREHHTHRHDGGEGG